MVSPLSVFKNMTRHTTNNQIHDNYTHLQDVVLRRWGPRWRSTLTHSVRKWMLRHPDISCFQTLILGRKARWHVINLTDRLARNPWPDQLPTNRFSCALSRRWWMWNGMESDTWLYKHTPHVSLPRWRGRKKREFGVNCASGIPGPGLVQRPPQGRGIGLNEWATSSLKCIELH